MKVAEAIVIKPPLLGRHRPVGEEDGESSIADLRQADEAAGHYEGVEVHAHAQQRLNELERVAPRQEPSLLLTPSSP